jgi:hypothetical protein
MPVSFFIFFSERFDPIDTAPALIHVTINFPDTLIEIFTFSHHTTIEMQRPCHCIHNKKQCNQTGVPAEPGNQEKQHDSAT